MAETQGFAIKQEDDFIMLPKVDFCFKELMDDDVVRKGFLSALLGKRPEQIKETELLPTILKKRRPDDKWSILDVRVKMEDGTQVDIEIQLVNYKDWPERSLFYLCKMFCDQLKEGELYSRLKKCIHVGILNFNLFNDNNYYSCFHFREDNRNDIYSDKLEIHILELTKVWNDNQPESDLLNWAKFLSGETKEDLASVAEKNSYINKAYERVLNISEDEEKRWEYEARMKALHDKNSMMNYVETSFERGEDSKLVKLICKKLSKGKSVDIIADEVEEDIELVQKICDVADLYAPDYDVDTICSLIFKYL